MLRWGGEQLWEGREEAHWSVGKVYTVEKSDRKIRHGELLRREEQARIPSSRRVVTAVNGRRRRSPRRDISLPV
jgi:hypothetical protein